MRTLSITCSTFLLSCTLLTGAHAADWPDTLDAAWRRLPEARASAALGDVAATRREAADSWFPEAPTLTIGERSDRFNRKRGALEYETELALPLWLPEQRTASRAAAESGASAQGARHDRLRLLLAGELRELAWSIHQAGEQHRESVARLQAAQALEDDIERRVRVGDLARSDLNLIRIERGEAEADTAEAEAQYAALLRRWHTLTGGETLPDPLLEALPESMSAAVPPADDEHPLLRERSAAVAAARAALALSRQTQRKPPELAVSYRHERGEYGEGFAGSVGIALKIPLSSATLNAPRLAEDNAALIAAETGLEDLRRRLDDERSQQQSALAAAARRQALAESNRQAARDNLALFEKSFALGELDLTGLLRARAAAQRADSAVRKAAGDHGRAIARLRQTLGLLP